jgi:hypothetical protein
MTIPVTAPENPVSPRFGINHPKVATRRFRGERFPVGPILDIALNLTSHHDRGVAMLFRFQLAARNHAVERRKRYPQLGSRLLAGQKTRQR